MTAGEFERGDAADSSPTDEHHYRELFENAGDVLYALDLDGRLTDFNRKGEEITGYRRHELLGRRITDLIPAEYVETMHRMLARKLEGESRTTYELEIHTKDGRRVPLEVSSRLLVREGRPVGLQGVARDISDRRRAEAALRESDERLGFTLAAARIGTWEWIIPTGEVRWSDNLEEVHGLPPGAFPGTFEAFLELVDGDDREMVLAAIRRAVEDGTPYDIEFRIVPPNGPVQWIAGQGRAFRDANGAPARMVGIGRNITVMKDAERLRAEFVSSLAHDLRNPLTAIKGQAQLLSRRVARLDAPGVDALVDNLARIDNAATRMTSLLDGLVDAARLEAGRALDLNREFTDLVALVRTIAEQHQRSTERHRIEMVSDVDALMGEWDAARLERVVTNLLDNAIKYSPAGGVIRVTLTHEQRPGGAGCWAALRVQDEGVGIPAADLPHIFERFRRAGNVAGRFSGSGIGLAGARQIVEQHGGKLDAASVEGRGSTFTIRLPLA